MSQQKARKLPKPPALSSVRQLNFKPNPNIQKALIEVGIEVQKELASQRRHMQPIDRVLRVIVR